MAEEEDAVLSDVDGDDDPVPIELPAGRTSSPSDDAASAALNQRLRDLQAELDAERQARKAAEDGRADLQNTFSRLKVLAHEAIRKRDEAVRERDEAARSAESAAAELAEAARHREEIAKQLEDAAKQSEASRSEMEAAAQMLVSGIEKVSGKVGGFPRDVLPRSQKYSTGLPAVAYGVIKRANEIVEELLRQVDAAGKARGEAREQVEQRNYEIAIEVSQLEATIAGLREEVSQKSSQVESLERSLGEKDGGIAEMVGEISQLRQFGEECEAKWKGLQAKLDSQRLVVMDQLNYISRAHEQIGEIIKNTALNEFDCSEFSESQFMWKEMDMDENLRTSLEGTVSVCELASVAAEKVRSSLEERRKEVKGLNETVARLLAEKSHIGNLLRSALSSKLTAVRQVAANGPREAGVDLKLDGKQGGANGEEDEVYTLAGVLEDTVKASQIEIIELQHLVESLRAETSLLKAQLDAYAKEISQQKRHIKELEEKEHLANESVEGLMIDIAAAEEEIARWKLAAEQEAAAGRAIEHDFTAELSTLRQELEDAKQAILESEGKLKFKEETAAAAIAARDAAVESLRLADIRATRLRERLEELSRQVEDSENLEDSASRYRQRYICWPWQWLGLNIVRYPTVTHESSNEMELSEPLV